MLFLVHQTGSCRWRWRKGWYEKKMPVQSPIRIFNLLDEPWIPCVFIDGDVRELSIRDIFREASRIRSISGDLPQQTIPLERLLLAILYRAYCDADWDREQMLKLWCLLWNRGSFDMDVLDDYFEEFHDRFYLIDPERPFYQVPKLTYAGEKEYDSVDEMIVDVPKPKKFLFSMRSAQFLGSIDFAQATRWLVFLHAYDIAGNKSPVVGNTHVLGGKVPAPKNMVGTGWLGGIGPVTVEGDCLFRTLLLNWCLYDVENSDVVMFGNVDDVPPWEQDMPSGSDVHARISFTGPVDALTFQSRRLRLIPNEDGDCVIGIVNCYGDVIASRNTNECEKMTAWHLNTPQQKKSGLSVPSLVPVRHDSSKALWRGLAPILEVKEKESDSRPGVIRWIAELQHANCLDGSAHILSTFSIHAQGMTYGTMNSCYETGIDDVLQLPLTFVRKDYPAINVVVDVVSKTCRAVDVSLTNYVYNLRTAAGDHAVGSRAQVASNRVREDAYARLDELFRNRIADFTPDKDYESYRNEWLADVYHILFAVGDEYLDNNNVPAFSEHNVKRQHNPQKKDDIMTAAQARRLFLRDLNKTFWEG